MRASYRRDRERKREQEGGSKKEGYPRGFTDLKIGRSFEWVKSGLSRAAKSIWNLSYLSLRIAINLLLMSEP